MKANSLKNLGKQNKVTVAGLLLLVFLGVKHSMDTRAGAIGSGDSWLTGQYMVLFVVCLLGALLFGYLLYGGWKLEHVFEMCIRDRIIREYAKRYPEVIKPILQTENQYSKGFTNISGTFNFPRAAGRYIAMCEGDDY